MSIKSITELKKETLEELEKIRSLNFTAVSQNNILALFAFNILLASPNMSRAKLVGILGEDIPKQVVAKAKKVVKYIKEDVSYSHSGQDIYLKATDFQPTNGAEPIRSVLKTYGHIERHEAFIKKELNIKQNEILRKLNENF